MHRPIVFRETFARPDLDVAGLRRQDGREFHDAAVAQFERADDLQIGDLDLVAAVILLGGGNGDFDETAAREDRLAVDHVFGEIREEMRVDVVFPASRIGVAAPAVEPIGLCGTSEEIRRIGRGRRPQFHRLEGQRGEFDECVPLAIDTRPVDGGTVGDCARHRRGDRIVAVRAGVAQQCRHHRSRHCRLLDRLLDVGAKDRTRRDLDEQHAAEIERGLGSGLETHGLANVLPPVVGIESSPVERGTRDGRQIGQLRPAGAISGISERNASFARSMIGWWNG